MQTMIWSGIRLITRCVPTQIEEGLKAGRVEGGSHCEVLVDRMRLFYLFFMGLHCAGMIPAPAVDRLFHIARAHICMIMRHRIYDRYSLVPSLLGCVVM